MNKLKISKRNLLFSIVACVGLVACANSNSAFVELKGQRYQIELADDADERTRGLMFREFMEDDHGMLFVFEQSAPQSFWMKNCKIPLDIMYFDEAGQFVSGSYNVPTCRREPCPSYPSESDARYVLELNAGVGRALNLSRDDKITLPQSIQKSN